MDELEPTGPLSSLMPPAPTFEGEGDLQGAGHLATEFHAFQDSEMLMDQDAAPD